MILLSLFGSICSDHYHHCSDHFITPFWSFLSVFDQYHQCCDYHHQRSDYFLPVFWSCQTRDQIWNIFSPSSELRSVTLITPGYCTVHNVIHTKKSGKFEVYLNYDTSEFKPCQPFHLWPTEFKKKFLEPLFLNVTSLSHYITSQLSTSTTMCLVFGPKVTKNTPQEKSKWVSYMTELDFKIIQQFINQHHFSLRGLWEEQETTRKEGEVEPDTMLPW